MNRFFAIVYYLRMDLLPPELYVCILPDPLCAARVAFTCKRIYRSIRRDLFSLHMSADGKAVVRSEKYLLVGNDLELRGLSTVGNIVTSFIVDGSNVIVCVLSPIWLGYTDLTPYGGVVRVLVDPATVAIGDLVITCSGDDRDIHASTKIANMKKLVKFSKWYTTPAAVYRRCRRGQN